MVASFISLLILSGVSVQFLQVSDDVARVSRCDMHVRHEHKTFVERLHAAFPIDRLWIGDKALDELRVILTDDVGEVRSAAAEMAATASQTLEGPLSAGGCIVVLVPGRRATEDRNKEEDRQQESPEWGFLAQSTTLPQRRLRP